MAPVFPSRRRTAARSLTLILLLTTLGASGWLPARAQSSPSLTVEPDGGLVAGQWVTASWTGVPDGTPVYLRQCTRSPLTIRDCSYLGGSAVRSGGIAPASGEGSLSFPVLGVVNGGNASDRFACDDAHPCSIALFTDPSATDLDRAVREPIAFAMSTETCPSPTSTDTVVSGQGTSSVARAFRGWAGRLCRSRNDQHLTYQTTSSPKAEDAFVDGDATYAITTRPLSSESQTSLRTKQRRFAYAPLVGSALVFAFRIDDASTGEPITSLRLTPAQLARIFTGQLADLGSDADIVAQNPGITFPPVVRAVGRSDASAQTHLLTSWFLSVAREAYRDGGAAFRGKATDTFPSSATITLLSSAKAVATAVADPDVPDASQFGTIGWMDSSVAAFYGLPTVSVENRAGAFVEPSRDAIATAIRQMRVNRDGVTRSADFRTSNASAYPLPIVSYLVAQTSVSSTYDEAEADVLRAFVRAVASNVDRTRTAAPANAKLPHGYAPLPATMTSTARRTAEQLPTTAYVAPSTGGGSVGGGGGFGTGSGGGPSGGGETGGAGGGFGTEPDTVDGTGTTPSPSPSPSPAPSLGVLPATTPASSSGGYMWPIVLAGGLALLVLGTFMPLALRLASRHGARQAHAELAAARRRGAGRHERTGGA